MRLLILFISMLFANNALAFSDEVEEGSYDCTGINKANNSNYTAFATVNKRGDHYIMTWDVDGVKYEGVGIIHDEEDDIIAFSFLENTDYKKRKKPLKSGVRIYHADDEILQGYWMFSDSVMVNTEKCTKREN